MDHSFLCILTQMQLFKNRYDAEVSPNKQITFQWVGVRDNIIALASIHICISNLSKYVLFSIAFYAGTQCNIHQKYMLNLNVLGCFLVSKMSERMLIRGNTV